MTDSTLSNVVSDKPWNTKGRFGRLSYLAWSFINILVVVLLCTPITLWFPLFETNDRNLPPNITGLVLLGLIIIVGSIIAIIFTIRRLHDLNRSGWWALLLLLSIVPVVGAFFSIVFYIYLWCFPGNKETNRFGAPRPTPTWEKVCGWLYAALPIIGILTAIAIPAYQHYVTSARQSQQLQYALPASEVSAAQ